MRVETRQNMNNKIGENRINGSKISTKLSKEQREAVFSNNRNLLVTAGPGSGKTVVIVNRIVH